MNDSSYIILILGITAIAELILIIKLIFIIEDLRLDKEKMNVDLCRVRREIMGKNYE